MLLRSSSADFFPLAQLGQSFFEYVLMLSGDIWYDISMPTGPSLIVWHMDLGEEMKWSILAGALAFIFFKVLCVHHWFTYPFFIVWAGYCCATMFWFLSFFCSWLPLKRIVSYLAAIATLAAATAATTSAVRISNVQGAHWLCSVSWAAQYVTTQQGE